jgi:hypothetical protein
MSTKIKKSHTSALISLGATFFAIAICSYVSYFMWDSQIEGNPYKVAFEKDGKLFDSNILGESVAFDRYETENHLYLNSFGNLAVIIAFSYEDFQTAKTDNPFFVGKIVPGDLTKYYETKSVFRDAKNSYQSYQFYDKNHNQILAYDADIKNDYIFKLLPTYPALSKNGRRFIYKKDFVDVTKLLKEKLNRTIKIRLDETNKILIANFD